MGEHGSWTDFLLDVNACREYWGKSEHALSRKWEGLMFSATHFTLTHVFWALIVIGIVIFGGIKFRSSLSKKDGMIPPKAFGFRTFFEMIVDATYGMMVQVMGEKSAKKHLPLIGALAFFIFFSDLMALVPGAGVPTTTLNTNIGIALLVFFATHYYGVKEHGLAYFKHFAGPLPLLAPLMIPIELISHVARPASLALRLMGNMAADHKVVFTFFTLVPLLVPVPFLILGLLVCIVQTLVFCLLSMVYISMATAHDH